MPQILVACKEMHNIIWSDELQEIKPSVSNIFALNIPYELKVEFEVYMNDMKIGKSLNGEFKSQDPYLDEYGKIWVEASKSSLYTNYCKALKNCGFNQDTLRILDSFHVKLISKEEICKDNVKIQLIITYYNIMDQSYVKPFGLISHWLFQCV